MKVGKIRYGYHSGVYYRPVKNGYRVVVGPPGAVIRTLPRGYKIVKVRGRKYYSYRGTYYRYDSGRRAYIVVRL